MENDHVPHKELICQQQADKKTIWRFDKVHLLQTQPNIRWH